MPLLLRIKNYVKFFIQSLQIVQNMQNSIETRGNLIIELSCPVVQRPLNKFNFNGGIKLLETSS